MNRVPHPLVLSFDKRPGSLRVKLLIKRRLILTDLGPHNALEFDLKLVPGFQASFDTCMSNTGIKNYLKIYF